MKKEEIYVVIDNEEKRLRALGILERAGEKVWKESCLLTNKADGSRILLSEKGWSYSGTLERKTEITLAQLEQLLIPMSQLGKLKQQAELLGYELVEKKREIKVGDFGVFFHNDYDGVVLYDFLSEIEKGKYVDNDGNTWDNFRHLTDEEKERVQNNW
jgi:hypothetical protein